MSLLDSFVHNVVVHPLLFVRDVAERRGYLGVALLLSRVHDDHAVRGDLGWKHELSVPPQEPWTEEAEAMVYRGRPVSPEREESPLRGSLADRVRQARSAARGSDH